MSDTPRTNALQIAYRKAWAERNDKAAVDALLESHAELERELAATNSRFEALAFDAARVEWKCGRNDDGTPKNWTEWNNLRESLGEHVRQPQELEPNEARH